MGCQIYTITSLQGEEVFITFSEMDETYGCLCCFPQNDKSMGIDAPRVRSLALLGAAVVIAHQGDFAENDYNYLPNAVPEWIRDGIDKAIDYKATTATPIQTFWWGLVRGWRDFKYGFSRKCSQCHKPFLILGKNVGDHDNCPLF